MEKLKNSLKTHAQVEKQVKHIGNNLENNPKKYTSKIQQIKPERNQSKLKVKQTQRKHSLIERTTYVVAKSSRIYCSMILCPNHITRQRNTRPMKQ